MDCLKVEELWKRDWLLANCIFVNLEHCLYSPEPVTPPMFQPVARAPVDLDQLEYLDPTPPPPSPTVIGSQTPPPNQQVLGKRPRSPSPIPISKSKPSDFLKPQPGSYKNQYEWAKEFEKLNGCSPPLYIRYPRDPPEQITDQELLEGQQKSFLEKKSMIKGHIGEGELWDSKAFGGMVWICLGRNPKALGRVLWVINQDYIDSSWERLHCICSTAEEYMAKHYGYIPDFV